MGRKVKVRFWMDESEHTLHIYNVDTDEVKKIKDEKKIVWFLNAHNQTVNTMKGIMDGYDVLGLFKEQKLLDFVPFLKRKQ